MDKQVYQSERLYVKMNGKYRWVKTKELFEKMGLDWEWKERKWIPQEEITANLDKPITEWPEHNGNNGNSNGHKTDKLYKMLYVCPWYSSHTGFGGLDEIKEVGFNTYHTWSILQWEQEGYFDTPEGRADCLAQVEVMLYELKKRNMYGCLQVPCRPQNLYDVCRVMKDFDNIIVGTVEEPDLHVPPSPTLLGQQLLYDNVKRVAPDLPVWGCFNGGVSERTFNPDAFDVLITDSYCYQRENGPVPGTKAASTQYPGDPWWNINPWIRTNKFKQLHNSVPKDMPIINIQQGMWNTSEGHVLPNMQEEWDLYHEEFGLNSFAVYPHGYAQGMEGVYVMTDSDTRDCGIKNQARSLMKKLDEKEVR